MPKLVRDRIPEIIRANGEDPDSYTADTDEYRARLLNKLDEETADLEQLRVRKAAERGGFADRIVLRTW